MALITPLEFAHAARNIADLPAGRVIGFDFETTGLSPYRGDRAFIMGFTDPDGNKFCVRDMCPETMACFFSNPRIHYAPHNGKFELSFLREQFGVECKNIWDTEVFARIEYNNHMKYSLQACAERLKLTKHVPMLEWLKKKGNKNGYHNAPPELIEPYVEQDAWLSWRLACHQMEVFRHWDVSSTKSTRILPVISLERRTTPHLFDMEHFGLFVDVNYCVRAAAYEKESARKAAGAFKKLTGVHFVDSAKTLVPVFDRARLSYGATEKGNPSFTEEAVSAGKDHPIVQAILGYRHAKKNLSSYWENFLELEHNGFIHPSINQNRADTGRMSISDPSCQNWPTDDDEIEPQFPVRRAFIAREGCFIASLDYSQMELRLMSDEAQDQDMIEKIRGGADLHQEVANMAGVSRSLAKNGRFARQYGGGYKRVAETLGVELSLARTICDAIDNLAQRNTAYSEELVKSARPYGADFLGRRFYFDRGFEYKAPNYRIQGGCGEILRVAICDVGDFLKQYSYKLHPFTKMLLPIHDEIVMNVQDGDVWILGEVKKLMIAAHRSKKTLEMDVSVHVGPNFYDLEKYEC